MRRLVSLSLATLAAIAAAAPAADAQQRRQPREPLVLEVRPRSFLDAGRVVPVGSLNQYATIGGAQHVLIFPPYENVESRFGASVLPDPIGAGRNPFGPVDYVAPFTYR